MLNTEYLKLFNKMKLRVIDPTVTSNDHTPIECLLCNQLFVATPKSKVTNFKKHGKIGCPKCTHNERYNFDRQNMIDIIKNNGYKILSTYKDVHTKILVTNTNCDCGRSWWSQPLNLKYADQVCRPCNDEKKVHRMHYYNNDRSKKAIQNMNGFPRYEKEVQLITEKIYRENIMFLSDNGTKVRGRGKYHLDHIIPITYCYSKNIPVDICANIENLRLISEADNVSKNNKITTNIPKIFDKYILKNDMIESFIKDIVSMIDVDFLQMVEISQTTLHLYSSHHNIGIRLATFDECSQTVAGYKALYTPWYTAKSENIRLISIYEDEWINNKNLVILKLKNIFNKSSGIKLNARDTKIKELTNDTKHVFLNNNHIQGNDKANISLGAYHNDKLVAVMTFSEKKAFSSKGKAREGWMELSRFCVDNNYIVRGIASKLMSFYKKHYPYKKIYSFCDLRWHDGKTYEIMGFKLSSVQPPSYYYVIDGKRAHKWSYGKSSLKKIMGNNYDETKTERQLTLELGYDRIWDCGKLRYELM